MAFFEDMFKGGNILTGVVVAVGATVLVPVVAPAIGSLLRPAAKAAIKGGILAYDRGRQAVAQLGEMASDVAAEARVDAERATSAQQSTSSENQPA
jgi:Protein of unknown function (DUF5132)